MAIKVNSNFEYQLKAYSDMRQEFNTITEMAAYNPNLIPDGFITFCKEDSTNYQWLELNDSDPVLSKWRKFTTGADVVDDALTESLTKTYSISKIKELIKASGGGFVLVDVLPDLDDEDIRADVEVNKIYLVPSAEGKSGNEKDEYICVHIEGVADTYREPLVTSDTDYDTWKTEIEGYVVGGGTLADDFATYSATNNTTTMTDATYAEMIESINESDADYDAYVARVGAEVEIPGVAESWAWEYIGSVDGGSLTITDDFIVSNPTGKVTLGASLRDRDVISIIKDMLSQDIPTTITLSGSPSATTLNEKGVSNITDVSLTATITLGTGVITGGTEVVFKKAGIELNREAYIEGQLTYTYTDAGANIVEDTTYSVEVAYELNGAPSTATNSITYKFAYPTFYGVSSTATIADPTALTKIVSADNTQTLTYTANNAYCAFVCEGSKHVTSIKDANNFENIDSWSSTTESIAIGAEQKVYNIYVTNTPVTCTNFKYIFTLG